MQDLPWAADQRSGVQWQLPGSQTRMAAAAAAIGHGEPVQHVDRVSLRCC
jgi:hypothetical protein